MILNFKSYFMLWAAVWIKRGKKNVATPLYTAKSKEDMGNQKPLRVTAKAPLKYESCYATKLLVYKILHTRINFTKLKITINECITNKLRDKSHVSTYWRLPQHISNISHRRPQRVVIYEYVHMELKSKI
jgi:hypothetical protein